jgi:predicted GIY-YIG superfamily endonuclease
MMPIIETKSWVSHQFKICWREETVLEKDSLSGNYILKNKLKSHKERFIDKKRKMKKLLGRHRLNLDVEWFDFGCFE